ncbi:MAG: LysR family transcriptional regulator [Burkholderiaceae bacterium]|nr:MAG: LysR family transcriptional regulator [Burkholderiaceae bacterium]
MELTQLDLNLLVVFDELMNVRKVSVAAENLSLSQPAVSKALNRLRSTFNDPLFQRTARGMKPTPLAELLAGPIAYALVSVKNAVNQRISFDSENSHDTFAIATTDFGESYLLAQLIDKFRSGASNVRVRSMVYQPRSLNRKMENGEIDIAIGLLPQLSAGYFQRKLLESDYVVLFRKGHPFASKRPSAADFMQARHILIESSDPGHYMATTQLLQSGLDAQIQFYVSRFASVPNLLRRSDLVATVPRIAAVAHEKDFDLAYAEHPLPLPSFSVNVFWHARYHTDPRNQWFRQLLFESQI